MSINQNQFKTLHDQYRGRLLNSMTAVVRDRDTAEDVTAAALATAWQNRNQFRGESSMYTWCYSIALNEARNRLRRNYGVSLESIDVPGSKGLTEPDALAPTLERAECLSQIRKALRRIPARTNEPSIERTLSMRYAGQNYERDVLLGRGEQNPVLPPAIGRAVLFHGLAQRLGRTRLGIVGHDIGL
jgi:DNA-directed RNA polymerase specialized sigma24 family protein